MAYTKSRLEAEVSRIHRRKENWMWEAVKDRPSLPNCPSKGITRPQDGGQVHLPTLLQYCWVAYDKAFRATGKQHIGRGRDLTAELRSSAANLHYEGPGAPANSSLLDDGTLGNIQQMGKWSDIVNDLWILGGVNRVATFELHSPRSKANLWDKDRKGFVVTGRELTGLLHFGYVMVGKHGKSEVWLCTKPRRAQEADLEEYHLANALKETMGEAGGLVHMQDFSLPVT